jgi:phosphohistidine phosphatase SixA
MLLTSLGCRPNESFVVTPGPAGERAAPVTGAQPITTPAPGTNCQFVFGFEEMRNVMGADRVGECIEDERHIAGNGNSEQRTTRGMLVLSALDSRVRFVTPERTWLNGPTGLVDRPNDQRLEWEGERQLVESLQRGGHYLYFRHGATDSSQTDASPPSLTDCSAQRNLTDGGRDQAANIGVQLRALKIPFGQIYSSPYCRASEFANLLFGKVTRTEVSMQLPDPIPAEERQRDSANFENLFKTGVPMNGSNTALVAHSPNIRNVFGLGTMADLPVEGGVAVLRPGVDKPSVQARILPDDWAIWVQAMAAR